MPAFYRNPNQGANGRTITLADFRVAPRIFLAEGASEAYFLNKLLEKLGRSADEYVVFCYGGNNGLPAALKSLSSNEIFSEVTKIGVMTDADDNSEIVRESVLNEFRKIGYIDSKTEMNEGLARHDGRTLGVFVTPEGNSVGRIETMIMNEISGKNEILCINQLRQCLEEKAGNSLTDKAICQIFISIKKDNLCGVGRAFDMGIFDINDPAYDAAVSFFSSI